MNTLEAIGHSICSTRILTVLSYYQFLKVIGHYLLHEISVNELAFTKEYLDKVLTELKASKEQEQP